MEAAISNGWRLCLDHGPSAHGGVCWDDGSPFASAGMYTDWTAVILLLLTAAPLAVVVGTTTFFILRQKRKQQR